MPWNVALSEVSWLIIIATGPQIIKKHGLKMAAPSKLQQQGATKVPHTFRANWNLLQNDCLNRVYMEYSRVTWLRIAGPIRGWGIRFYGAIHTGLTWPCNGGKPNCLPHTHLNLTCMYYIYIYYNIQIICVFHVYFVQTRRTTLWWFYTQ